MWNFWLIDQVILPQCGISNSIVVPHNGICFSTVWNWKNEFLADFCSTVTPQFSSTVATQLFHTSRNSTLWKNFGKWTKSWNIIFHSFSTVFTQMGHTFHILWNTLVFSSAGGGGFVKKKVCPGSSYWSN